MNLCLACLSCRLGLLGRRSVGSSAWGATTASSELELELRALLLLLLLALSDSDDDDESLLSLELEELRKAGLAEASWLVCGLLVSTSPFDDSLSLHSLALLLDEAFRSHSPPSLSELSESDGAGAA